VSDLHDREIRKSTRNEQMFSLIKYGGWSYSDIINAPFRTFIHAQIWTENEFKREKEIVDKMGKK